MGAGDRDIEEAPRLVYVVFATRSCGSLCEYADGAGVDKIMFIFYARQQVVGLFVCPED